MDSQAPRSKVTVRVVLEHSEAMIILALSSSEHEISWDVSRFDVRRRQAREEEALDVLYCLSSIKVEDENTK